MRWWVLEYMEAGLHVWLISHIFWLILSITLHELAHGWAAIWQGDDTPRRLGHLTASPLVHMGPQSLLMVALLGIGWGQMPIEPGNFRWKRRGRIVVALAGPAMNVVLAIICISSMLPAAALLKADVPLHDNVLTFLWVGGWLNLALAAWNLMPLWPLDGAQALMGASFGWYRFFNDQRVQLASQFIYFAVFLSGLGFFAFHGAQWLAGAYLNAIGSLAGDSFGVL